MVYKTNLMVGGNAVPGPLFPLGSGSDLASIINPATTNKGENVTIYSLFLMTIYTRF